MDRCEKCRACPCQKLSNAEIVKHLAAAGIRASELTPAEKDAVFDEYPTMGEPLTWIDWVLTHVRGGLDPYR